MRYFRAIGYPTEIDIETLGSRNVAILPQESRRAVSYALVRGALPEVWVDHYGFYGILMNTAQWVEIADIEVPPNVLAWLQQGEDTPKQYEHLEDTEQPPLLLKSDRKYRETPEALNGLGSTWHRRDGHVFIKVDGEEAKKRSFVRNRTIYRGFTLWRVASVPYKAALYFNLGTPPRHPQCQSAPQTSNVFDSPRYYSGDVPSAWLSHLVNSLEGASLYYDAAEGAALVRCTGDVHPREHGGGFLIGHGADVRILARTDTVPSEALVWFDSLSRSRKES